MTQPQDEQPPRPRADDPADEVTVSEDAESAEPQGGDHGRPSDDADPGHS